MNLCNKSFIHNSLSDDSYRATSVHDTENRGSLCYDFMAKKLVINRSVLRSMFISMLRKTGEKST